MPTALEAIDLIIRHALGESGELFILSKKSVAIKATVFGCERLHLSVDSIGKGAGEGACQVAGEQTIPIAAPHQLDDIPSCASEKFFELIDDAPISAHWAVQALQVAIDHPD